MKMIKYQIDAFADKVFEGNPAVVCPVEEFPETWLMQNIAMEHQLSETAFIVKKEGYYDIRWFTPVAEVELCGHATLASAYVVFEILKSKSDMVHFQSLKRGRLSVQKVNDLYELDFPAEEVTNSQINITELQACFNEPFITIHDGRTDSVLLFEDEKAVERLTPDYNRLRKIDRRGFIATSTSKKYDFVSRFFAPRFGVNEDPVTGSAHTLLIPYWSKKLNKINLLARQISQRGGVLHCTFMGERVKIAGGAVLYSKGEIFL